MSAQDPDQSRLLDASKTVEAIHDAFLIGWSLQELKSRVLLKASGLPSSAAASDSTDETRLTTGSSATTPLPPFNMGDTLLKAFLPSESPATSQTQVLPGNFNESIARTSEWQAIFTRIASIHDQCFPGSTTQNTLYDPSPTSPPKSRYPYLYPSTSPDYGLIGTSGIGSVGVGDIDKQLGQFELYDVTRRALNCLCLLYTKPEESLVPDILNDYQTEIMQSIFKDAQAPGTVTPAASLDISDQKALAALVDKLNQKVADLVQDYLDNTPAEPSSDDLNLAIKFLSFLTVRFLESWDGYLRENFFIGGKLKNNELELLAYEAGRSLSSLSWSISMMTVPLENASEQDTDSAQLVARTWLDVFESSHINSVQRQISALGPALDDAYYVIKQVQRTAAGELPDPDLPGNAIHAITYSLYDWQRALDWICHNAFSGTTVSTTAAQMAIKTTKESAVANTPPVDTTVSTTTTEAAIKMTTASATVSNSPSDGTANPPALAVDLSRKLRLALITQAGIWQTLMLGEQTLMSFTTGGVTKRILNNIMAEFENAAKEKVVDTTQKQLKRFWLPMIGLGILLLVILAGGIFLLAQNGQLQSLAAIIALLLGSALTLVSTFLTRISSTFSPASDQRPPPTNTAANTTNMDQRLSSLVGLAGESIITAFQNAYKQILIEFDDLNHYVAISYPLIDFFMLHFPHIDNEEMKDGYIFLTKIVWTSDERREEVERVARAAFGPLGAFIGSRSNFSPS
jgi:hypothetical protein